MFFSSSAKTISTTRGSGCASLSCFSCGLFFFCMLVLSREAHLGYFHLQFGACSLAGEDHGMKIRAARKWSSLLRGIHCRTNQTPKEEIQLAQGVNGCLAEASAEVMAMTEDRVNPSKNFHFSSHFIHHKLRHKIVALYLTDSLNIKIC